MYTAALLALAPIAAQAAQAAQAAGKSVRWPVFNLRANVTESYTGYTTHEDARDLWHNAPIGATSDGDNPGPLLGNDCAVHAGMNDHGLWSEPYIFYPRSTTTGTYAPSELMAGSDYKMQIAQKNQKDAKGRRAVVMSRCGGKSSTSIYITDSKPHHLTYDNKEAKNEKFGSFYLCGNRDKGDYFSYGDGLFYRSADETTPEECGEVIFYPECMPLSYKITTTQATSIADIYTGRDQTGHYDAWCYVDVKDVAGGPNSDIMEWYNQPRTRYFPVGKVQA